MDHCCENKASELEMMKINQAKVLKIVMVINFVMFFVEYGAGLRAHSTALMADSLDMLGDAIVYAFSLYVLHKSAKWLAVAALGKGIVIFGFGISVLVEVLFKLRSDVVPVAQMMWLVSFIALVANTSCLILLYRHRDEDINMKSTFICSRNDILSNCGVLIAGVTVMFTHSKWPDIGVGLLIGAIFLHSAWGILLESLREFRKVSV